MKKLVTVLLILAMLLPAAVLAEEPDPIIGNWYFLYDKSIYPEFAASFNNADIGITVYWFMDSGTIMATEVAATGTDGTASFAPAGRWSKDSNKYSFSIIGIGEGAAILEGDNILIQIQGNTGYYMVMHRMIPFNPYKDYAMR